MNVRNPVDSIREAVLTVSPKRQYLGIVRPTTPATHDPKQIGSHPKLEHPILFINIKIVCNGLFKKQSIVLAFKLC